MLNSTRQLMKLYRIDTIENEWKEQIKEEVLIGEIPVSLSFNGYSKYQVNDLALKNCNYIGITNNAEAKAGMKLENYSILFVLPIGSEFVLYLQELK